MMIGVTRCEQIATHSMFYEADTMNSPHTITFGIYTRNSWDSGWTSKENNVVEGTVRLIDGQLFKAGVIYPEAFRKNKVLWWRITEKELQGKNDLPSEKKV